ncbi:hypothetical protein NL108_003338 [Boleophthalmus pectinirostris]|nr:hypothetical protein NL108_003338 [Boleophthalmus pectinirostris]
MYLFHFTLSSVSPPLFFPLLLSLQLFLSPSLSFFLFSLTLSFFCLALSPFPHSLLLFGLSALLSPLHPSHPFSSSLSPFLSLSLSSSFYLLIFFFSSFLFTSLSPYPSRLSIFLALHCISPFPSLSTPSVHVFLPFHFLFPSLLSLHLFLSRLLFRFSLPFVLSCPPFFFSFSFLSLHSFLGLPSSLSFSLIHPSSL